ncbi:MAG: 50S ribosomal protein L10 [candidate division Zixibacteria bacterium]|nr:50S ribosomal protein L10 [candidate division Zixibacteria bacterium]
MPKPEKIESVSEVKKYLQDSKSVFVTDYTGLNVADITRLRKNLRDSSVKYLVAKNTLIKIAAQETGYEGIVDHLSGQTALAFGFDDPSVPAKILYNTFKEKQRPVIKVFVVDKKLFAGAEIVRLAELPTRDVLLAQVVAAVESPISSLIMSIDGVFQELVGTLDALAMAKTA